MYFQRLKIENYGPLKDFDIQFPFSENGDPKPLIIVGKNGSGKSIFLSHLVNGLMIAKEAVYPNTEVTEGRVYKLRSPHYITAGQHYAFMKIHLSNDLELHEWILSHIKSDFEEIYKYSPARREWAEIPADESSLTNNNFHQKQKELKQFVNNNCSLYFPANRFEEPSWLNEENLLSKPEHTDRKRIAGISERKIICHSPLKTNVNWLFDLILDRELYERLTQNIRLPVPSANAPEVTLFQGYSGTSHATYEEAIKLLRVILRDDRVRFGIGNRQARLMSVMRDTENGSETVVPHIFQLSTGETALLNLFLSILRDYDLSHGGLTNLTNITGTVIIDEIDAHLHTQLQYEVLPRLISLFPKVQFIITTHSPLFLLGLEKTFGTDGIEIMELPSGQMISTEKFSEFEEAYKTFMQTEKFNSNIEEEILKTQKPIVFVEGDYDIRYLNASAKILGKENLLSRVHLKNGDGFRNLDKIWNDKKWSDPQLVNKRMVLLYDCDTDKNNEDLNNLSKRIVSTIDTNPIKRGIENLFSEQTISKAMEHKADFIDIEEERRVRQRGQWITEPEIKTVNKNEKGNLCDWLCLNGDESDFTNFATVFDMLEETLSLSDDR